MTYNPSYNNQNPGGYQPAKPRVERKVVGGWTCAQYGGDPQKDIQYEITEIPTRKGGHFFSIEFFKNYTKRDGSVGRSFNFPASKIRDLVEKINHYLMTYETGQNRGCFVFQPMPQQVQSPQPGYGQPYGYQQPPQPQYHPGYGAAPQQGYPAYPPQPQQGYAPSPQPSQQEQVLSPPPPGSAPNW